MNQNDLPCEQTGDCPYEYDKDSDRDVEGMPFVDEDPRSCPEFGHICPQYMEDFGLTVEDLRIRAIIHCGAVMTELIVSGEVDPKRPGIVDFLQHYIRTLGRYPESDYPQYY